MENAYLNTAKRDFEASKLLFQNKLYPESIYHLQQCHEKIVKSFCIALNVIQKDKARQEISHFAHRMHLLFIKKIKNILSNVEQNKDHDIFSEYNENDAKRSLENIYNRYLNNDKKLLKQTIEEIKSVNSTDFWHLLGLILKKFIKKPQTIDYLTDTFRIIFKGRFKIEEYYESFKSFYFLSTVPILTSVHDQKTRYPEFENGNIYRPEIFYTEDNLIMKNFDLLIMITEYIIQFTENVINGKENFFEKSEN